MFIFGDGNKIEKVNGVTIGTFVYSEGVFVVEVDNRLFLVMNKKINNSIDNKSNKSKPTRNIDDFAEKIIKNRISFGGEDSFIVDMQGIKNFINASSLDFKDYYIRTILKETGIMKGGNYLRVGVSGAPNVGSHPGGEVFEENN